MTYSYENYGYNRDDSQRDQRQWNHHRTHQRQGRGTDLLLGLLGGAIGVMAMDVFSQQIMPMFESDDQQQGNGQQGQSQWQQIDALDSISAIGKHHRQQESSTAALGRIVYQWLTDDEPGQETKSMLSYGVHWGYGIAQGGVYGAWQGEDAGHNLGTELAQGVAFGTALWLLGDEGAVPMLGLQKGPTASPLTNHAERLAMHMVYGAATAAATHALKRTVT